MSVDLILRGGTIVDVVAKRCYGGDILIKDGLIQDVTHTSSTIAAAETLDVTGQYVIPGFIDPHLHIESSLLSPLEFTHT
ncbi:MAG: adenine deaminase, partial [Chloroflexota bacterium]|nr:adenine deaminase [Chloroflexota bacterium]